MLSARWIKVLNDLFGSKTRTVLIVLVDGGGAVRGRHHP